MMFVSCTKLVIMWLGDSVGVRLAGVDLTERISMDGLIRNLVTIELRECGA